MANPIADSAISGQLAERPIVVIGSGPVGMRLVQTLCQRRPDVRVILFGNEPVKPYNRVQLSALLAGEVTRQAIDIPLPSADLYPNFTYQMLPIGRIDRENRMVIAGDGQSYRFDTLVIATGASAHIPSIPGVGLAGVYTFRNLKDAESLSARILKSRHIVVIGGGLLGVEAAKGLLKYNTRVTLVQQGPRLMNRQLNEEAAGLLQKKVEALGIRVVVNSGVRKILGEHRVAGVQTYGDELIECDTVLLCAGIKPNIGLALDAGLPISTGILVNDQLQTSDAHIYAVGECCEHRGQTYGLVNPGFEQAAVAAEVISGGRAKYLGSQAVSRLKVIGETVFSFGEVVELPARPWQSEILYRDKARGSYRYIVLHKGLVIGALGIGDWPELNRVQEAFRTQRKIWRWQSLLFRFTGRLWPFQGADAVAQWPANAVVCQCNSVSQGRLMEVIRGGCSSQQLLQEETGAGAVCGTCKPLLAQLLGVGAPLEKEKGWRTVLLGSLAASALALVIAVLPEAKAALSVQRISWFELIWNDPYWKQVTGFSLLGLSLIGLLMSLRKRLDWRWMGKFSSWRAFHALLGAVCAVVLVFHTGFHLGENLNLWLMMNFLGVLLVGAATGAVVALSHKMQPVTALRLRKTWNWLHLLVTWPLPALVMSHLLTVYYF